MKTIPIALAAHYAQDTTTVAVCMKVTRTDGVAFGFTSLDKPIVVEGVTYSLSVDVSALASSSGLGVDNLEMTIIPDENVERLDLIAGRWDNAAFEIFEVNYDDISDGINPLKSGTLGEVGLNRGKFTDELRSLTQALQQPIGDVTSKNCRYRFGDARCTVDLEDYTHDAVVTDVDSNQIFTASSLTQDDEYFQEGYVTFTSGDNEGYSQKCKLFASGMITLSLPMPFTVAVDDEFTAVAGCQKRHLLDCKDTFNNLVNFGGEPHLPGVDEMTRNPTRSV